MNTQSVLRMKLAALAVLLVSISSVRANTQPLQLAGGGCTGLEFTDLGQKFHYTAQLAVTSGNQSCIRSALASKAVFVTRKFSGQPSP